MPGTRGIGGFLSRTAVTKSPRLPSFSPRLRTTISLPRRQVTITTNTHAAITSGTHPPWRIFVRVEAKNATSKVRNTTAPSATRARRVRQIRCATARNRIVLRTNVPVTATPYADPRAVDEPKPTTRAMTAANSTQLTPGA